MTDDELFLIEDSLENSDEEPWKILVVDDEPDIHSVTKLVFDRFNFRNRPVRLLHCYSATEAKTVLERNEDIAVVLLDIIMETDDAGLRLARYIRDDLNNHITKIILRTGQPGIELETQALINFSGDYFEKKSELTAERLIALVHASLASYEAQKDLTQQSNELQKLVENSDFLINSIAHDLESPAKNLTDVAKLLAMELANKNPDPNLHLKEIEEAKDRIQNIVSALHYLAELKAQPQAFQIANLDSILKEALSELDQNILDSHAKVTNNVLGSAYCNRDSIKCLLKMLIENSIKYKHPDRALEINIERIDYQDRLVLQIKDTGVGIEPTEKKNIFHPFHRGLSGSDDDGAGIALALCNQIAKLHHGYIEVAYHLENGCAFSLVLPKRTD